MTKKEAQVHRRNKQESVVYVQTLLVKLAILKFLNHATAKQIIGEVKQQTEVDVGATSIHSCLKAMVVNRFVVRGEDPPESKERRPKVVYSLSVTGRDRANLCKANLRRADLQSDREIYY